MPPYDQDSDPGDENDYEAQEKAYLRHCNDEARTWEANSMPPACVQCEHYFAIEDGLCQFCEAEIMSNVPDIFEGFSTLLGNHMAFARWEEDNAPRIARA